VRTFLSIEIDKTIKESLEVVQKKYRYLPAKISFPPKENIHLTLKFLGELTDEQIEKLKQGLEKCFNDIRAFNMEFFAAGVFPSKKRVRVIWVGVKKGEKELVCLSENIEPLFKELNLNLDDRPFSPHVTIGRVKSVQDRDVLINELEKFSSVSFGTQRVEKISLMKSTLTPQKAIHEPIAEFWLL